MDDYGQLREALEGRGYRLERELGRGGMGVVYLARQLSLDRPVALKVLLAENGISVKDLRRFRREARIVQGLIHPNIVRLLDHELASEHSFLAFEYVEGARNWTPVAPDYPRTVDRILEPAREIVEGLAYIHRSGIVHRDLKPGNVLVDASGRPRIIDLGLARRVTDEETQLTRSGEMIGTVAYMAPEQLLGEEVDARCDVYSLGLLLYEVAAGKPVFSIQAENPITPLERLSGRLPAVSRFNPTVPSAVERLISRCTAVARQDRPVDGAAVHGEIVRMLERRPDDQTMPCPCIPLFDRPGPPPVDEPSAVPATDSQIAPPTSSGPPREAGGVTPYSREPWRLRQRCPSWLAGLCWLSLGLAAGSVLLPRWFDGGELRSGPDGAPILVTSPSFEFSEGALYLRATTTYPGRACWIARRNGREEIVSCEGQAVREHRLLVGRVGWADLDRPVVRFEFDGKRTPPIALAPALEQLSVLIEGTISRFCRGLERHLTSAPGRKRPADPAGLELVVPEPELLAALLAATPWIHAALSGETLPASRRLRLATALARLALFDHLCRSRLRAGRGQLHSLLPEELRSQSFSVETTPVVALMERLSKATSTPGPSCRIAGSAFSSVSFSGPGIDGLSLGRASGPLLLGYAPRHPADDLETADSGRTPSDPGAPTTGPFSISIPPRFVMPGRRLFMGLQRGCLPSEAATFLVVNRRLHLLFDHPCPPGRTGRPGSMAQLHPLPAGAIQAGDNVVECTQARIAGLFPEGAMWFHGLQLYSME